MSSAIHCRSRYSSASVSCASSAPALGWLRANGIAFSHSLLITEAKILGRQAQTSYQLRVKHQGPSESAAAFNLNVLARINRAGFRQETRYDRMAGKIEMHLCSRRAHTVSVGGIPFGFAEDDDPHRDLPQVTIGSFQALARDAGLVPGLDRR
jgi:hypothetical protein